MSLVVTRRTRAHAAGRTDSGARSSSRRYRRDDTANTANAFSRLETHRGLPTGTIALRRRRARVVVFAFVGERAFGFASATSAFRCVRGSMFSLFSSSQLAYARCRGKLLVFLPGLPAFRVAHGLAASGPIFHLRCALAWGHEPFFYPRTHSGRATLRAAQLSSNDPLPARESVAFARLFGWSATPWCRLAPAPHKSVGLEGPCQLGPRGRRTMVPSTAVGPALRKSAGLRDEAAATRLPDRRQQHELPEAEKKQQHGPDGQDRRAQPPHRNALPMRRVWHVRLVDGAARPPPPARPRRRRGEL